ncbi:MAG: hypothetical protein F6K42_36970 [Leptolyngbya sp. SIO1D8]|nr:hypothetical protein [Leptolyngbya sp. SIO1D8]
MIATIFDIDGTLKDTTFIDDKCFIEAFDSIFGIDINNQNWSELKHVTDWGITEEIVFKKWAGNQLIMNYRLLKPNLLNF